MQTKQKLVILALCCSSLAVAQNNDQDRNKANQMDASAFTFSEAQLGEDDDMTQNVTILNSNTNMYASEIGFLFSPMRFRYRAFNQKYNDIYINGALVNDLESGQFRYSMIGGLNQQTRNVDFALPFESNNFSIAGMGGSNNYNFRAGNMASGHRFSVAGANRNYTLRGMYTYASGFNSKGWAVAANVTYRWANKGYVEGTFYNSLSYFLGIQKKWNDGHSLSFSTWGNPTERSTQGASTDEAYWLANDRYYNPYWGYQNGHKRNSRVVNDFAPSALLTWDWDVMQGMKLTTTLFGT
ncbi:MAG: TonB-dependent receptor, partial [Prevotella sp.]|nr:TonB-dependent receptor [Prevotella sp.]